MTLRTKDTSKDLNLLSEKNKHPFDDRIKFQEEGHRYWIDNNDEDLVSSTTYIHEFFGEFNTEKVIKDILSSEKYKKPDCKYYKMTYDDIKNQWESNRKIASEAGTNMHADIEHFYNGLEVVNDSDEFKQFLSFYKDHQNLEIYRTEWMIFCELLRITGSVDAIFKNEDGTLSIGDWKRSKQISYNSFGNKVGKFPFDNLEDCNYYHYSLQLNLYRIILEKFYGEKVKEMFLVVLHPDNKDGKYKKIVVDRMDKEANYLLDFRRNQLIELGYSEEMFKDLILEYKIDFNKKDDIVEDEIIVPTKRLLLKKNESISRSKEKNMEETKVENPSKTNDIDNNKKVKINKEISIESLSGKQKEAYNLIKKGNNVLLTGMAGSGKTAIIKLFSKEYKNIKTIGITSTTGTSAILINGVTLHSYLGIGLGKDSADALYLKIINSSFILKRWKELQILIIDEISMLDPDLFDKLELLSRKLRKNESPFGGIQLILTGDFLQLPCVKSEKFCFEAKTWSTCINNIINLKEIYRQDDIIFQKCLNEIRIGKLSKETINILKSRIGIKLKNEHGIIPTKLYSLNKDVDTENQQKLDNLLLKDENLEFYQYELEHTVLKKGLKLVEEKIKKSCIAPQLLEICIGAQVMLITNLDLENGLANGSRGIVIRFEEGIPVVKFLNGIERLIESYTWTIEENGSKILSITQIPLKVAFAISIHKCQGISLDFVEIDLGGIFEYGQAYVSLSRVRTLNGLSIKNLNIDKIIANPKALDFYNSLK
jgi:ATP-dependent DNA helicase PIF1